MEWQAGKELARIKSYNPYKRPKKLPDYHKLDSNENLVLEEKFIKAIALKSLYDNDFREYPLEQFETLFTKIAKYVNLNTKNIGIGSGSDQVMDLLLSTLCRGKRLITINPTFSYFTDRCNFYGIPVKSIDLATRDNSLDFEHFIDESKENDIIYLASPNNPTGNQFKFEEMVDLIERSQNKLIIIDEAYVEFSDYSLSSLVDKHSNLILMRTFSKAFGLAGARIGYMLANEEITDVFNKYIQLPYPLSRFSMQIAIEALENIEIIRRSINTIKKERERIFKKLKQVDSIRIYESDANFFFFQTYNHFSKINEHLSIGKILVKSLGKVGSYSGAIRATIGNPEVNDKLISAIERAVEI
jgi:histidinol-phosphate aminotransferase